MVISAASRASHKTPNKNIALPPDRAAPTASRAASSVGCPPLHKGRVNFGPFSLKPESRPGIREAAQPTRDIYGDAPRIHTRLTGPLRPCGRSGTAVPAASTNESEKDDGCDRYRSRATDHGPRLRQRDDGRDGAPRHRVRRQGVPVLLGALPHALRPAPGELRCGAHGRRPLISSPSAARRGGHGGERDEPQLDPFRAIHTRAFGLQKGCRPRSGWRVWGEKSLQMSGSAYGIRTRVTAVRAHRSSCCGVPASVAKGLPTRREPVVLAAV